MLIFVFVLLRFAVVFCQFCLCFAFALSVLACEDLGLTVCCLFNVCLLLMICNVCLAQDCEHKSPQEVEIKENCTGSDQREEAKLRVLSVSA